jgi:hypothetical protein
VPRQWIIHFEVVMQQELKEDTILILRKNKTHKHTFDLIEVTPLGENLIFAKQALPLVGAQFEEFCRLAFKGKHI